MSDRAADEDLARVQFMCAGFPPEALLTTIEIHRANCRQPGCPVLAAMERVAAEQRTRADLRTCPGCDRKFAMLHICERCGLCDARDDDDDRDPCCRGDASCVERDWRSNQTKETL